MLKGHPKGSAPTGDKKLTLPVAKAAQHYDANRGLDADGDAPGYADGGKVNFVRSTAEKKVDALYGKPTLLDVFTNPAADKPATEKMNKKIEDAGG